ncbi:MAG: radical SAM protein [Magnetococcales bacterium]|nr:radical SAM protein [Magnetococcales bacterium]
MLLSRVFGRIVKGLPFLLSEVRLLISCHTPWMVSVPRSIHLTVTERCNGLCKMCFVGMNNADKNFRGQSKVEIPKEDTVRLIREAKELSGSSFYLALIGGELLLYHGFAAALEESRKHNISLTFTTNGYTLNDTNVNDIIRSNPMNVSISLESIDPEINERLRSFKNGTRKTMEGIDRLIKQREANNADFSVIIKSIVTEVNFRQLPDVVRRYAKIPKVLWNPQPFYHNADGVAEHMADFSVKDVNELREVIDEIKELRRQGYAIVADEETLENFIDYFRDGLHKERVRHNKRCTLGYTHMFVSPSGGVIMCPYILKSVGNVFQGQSLKEIWNSPEAKAHREEMASCRINCNATCSRPVPFLTKVKTFLRM